MFNNDYIAGFCDGEGYFGIIKKTDSHCTAGHYFKPVVKIAQAVKRDSVLDRFKEKFGGYISKTREHKEKNAQASRMWEISGRIQVSKFLDEVGDSIVLKRPQVEILRKFVKLPSLTSIQDLKERKKSLDLMESYYKQIKLLNKTGVAETE